MTKTSFSSSSTNYYLNPLFSSIFTSSASVIKPRLYSTSSLSAVPIEELNPWFVTGFCDAESWFGIKIIKSPLYSLGWRIQPVFEIGVHSRDKELLILIRNYFSRLVAQEGVGKISTIGHLNVKYNVTSIKELELLIKHFDNYPLITHKFSDYMLWRQVILMVLRKEHLTKDGLYKIVAIKASLNKGLSVELKTAFPNTIPANRPVVVDQVIRDPYWIAGFTSGEGCFFVNFIRSSTHRLGFRIILRFTLTQHSRDEQLIRSLIDYFDCGNVYLNREAIDYQVQKFSDLDKIILPFFYKYPILGVKKKDFEDFCKVSEIVKEKGHLTIEGLDLIRNIKAGMNKGRGL